MSRELTSHKVNGLNEALTVIVVDQPGHGGASHVYDILDASKRANMTIRFQNGPIAEVGVNGISQEALLAIVEDRLACFQRGPYACDENQSALEAVRDAMDYLKSRTTKRVERGVEGTSAV